MKKYTVTYKDDSIDTFESDHYQNVVNYLSDDDQVKHLAYQDYITHLDGSYNEDHLAERICTYLEEFAAAAGYTIKENV